MIRLKRELDAIERSYTLDTVTMYPTDVVRYTGEIDQLSLATAYRILCVEHPVLCSDIYTEASGGNSATISVNSEGRIEFLRGDLHELRTEVQRLCNEPRIAAELIHVRCNGGGLVALAANHAVFDAPAFIAMFDQLWELYTRLAAGKSITIAPRRNLPSSAAQLIRERWDSQYIEPNIALQQRQVDKIRQQRAETPVANRIKELTLQFGNGETSSIVEHARTADASVHSVVCAAVTIAQRAIHPTESPLSMLCVSAVNLRTRVMPTVTNTETTIMQGLHIAQLSVRKNSDCLDLATEIKAQLQAAISRRRLAMVTNFPEAFGALYGEETAGSSVVSNWGRLNMLAHPPAVRIVDRIEPVFHGLQSSGQFPSYLVSSYNDELKLVCMFPSYSFDDKKIEAICYRISTELREMS